MQNGFCMLTFHKKPFSGEGIPPLGHQQPSTSAVPYWDQSPGLMISSHGNAVSENHKSLHHFSEHIITW
jgi:hypothetical protein